MKQYSIKEFEHILHNNNFRLDRTSKHKIYVREGKSIAVPSHSKDINKMMCQRLIKEYSLVV